MTHSHTPRTLAVFALLFGLAIIRCLADDSREQEDTSLNSLKLSQGIWEAANDGMGLRGIQETFDKYGRFSSQVPDWPAVTGKLANITGERFGNFTVALSRLRLAIEAHYNSSDDDTNIPKCCDVTGTKFQKAFKREVDAHQLCTRVSPDAESNLDLPGKGFRRESRENSQGYPYIKWQYYGTEEGGLRLYPAFNVDCNFSPRLRPWYVETFAPDPKDIVIVVDGTSNGGDDLVIRSVLTIIDTTNPNDRIGVVRFGETASTPVGSEKNSTCYKTTLALATPANKEYLKWYVSQAGRTRGAAKYIPALQKAFSLLANTDNTSHNRRQVLLFFTHSNPDDALPKKTIDLVKEKMVKKSNQNTTRLTILTYGAGLDIEAETEDLLETLSNLSFSGSYTHLTSTSNLRYNLKSYYSTLSHPLEHPLFVLPYIDGWGLGLVISICQPFFEKNSFQGVVCLDGTLGDLLSDVINIRQGVEAYSFIVDNQGRTIHHPYLAQPNDDNKFNLNVHISMLERSTGPEAKEIIAAITEGKPGGRSIRVPLSIAKATFPGQWVERPYVTKHYEWSKIPNTNYTLCIVSTGNDVQLNLTVMKQTPKDYLNAHHIRDNEPCMHQGLTSTIAKSSVNLDAKAFYKDCEDETEDDKAQTLTIYFKSKKQKERHHCIKDYVYDEVQLTGMADMVWKSELAGRYNEVILWRHLMTLGGVRRIYPGVHYHLHTPLVLPWYVKALSDVGRIILTRSNVSSNSIITMSHVVYEGRASGIHADHNLPVAVLAAEFRYSYIMNMVLGLMPSCQDKEYSCLLVDESGLVLLHTDVREDQHDKLGHVFDMEPSLARHLISRGFLTPGNCTNVEHLRIETFWRLSIPGVSITDTYFEMQAISETNAFIVRKDKGAANDANTCPPCLNSGDILPCKSCDQAKTKCNCPCYCDLQFDYCNYTFASTEPFTCPLSVMPTSVKKDDVQQQLTQQYQTCFESNECRSAKSENDCFLLPACKWCVDKEEDVYMCSAERQCKNSEGSNKAVVAAVLVLLFLAFAAVIAIICFLRTRGYKCIETTWCQKCPGWTFFKPKEEEVYSHITEVVAMQGGDDGPRAPAVPPSGAQRWSPKGVDNVAYDNEIKPQSEPFNNYYSNALSVKKEPSKDVLPLKDPIETEPSATRLDFGVTDIIRRPPPIPTFSSSNQSHNRPSLPITFEERDAHLHTPKSAEPRPNLKSVAQRSFSNPYLTTPAELELKEEAEEEASSSNTQDTKPSEHPTSLVSDNGPELHKHDVVDLGNAEVKDYQYLSPVVPDQQCKDTKPDDSNPGCPIKRQGAVDEETPSKEKSDSGGVEVPSSPKELKRQAPDGEDEGFLYLPMSARNPIISDLKVEIPNDSG